jgi:hypothetical protein
MASDVLDQTALLVSEHVSLWSDETPLLKQFR